MTKSSAVIVGNRDLWRIDPTGQFWNCYAVAIGRSAETAEELLVQHIQSLKGNETWSDVFQQLSPNDAVTMCRHCMEQALYPKSIGLSTTGSSLFAIPWHGIILEYSSSSSMGKPKQTRIRGTFLPSNKKLRTNP